MVTVDYAQFDLEGPILLDLTDVSDEPVPEGWHAFEVEKADPGYSPTKGIPQVAIGARLIDEADPSYQRMLFWQSHLVGEGRRFTRRFLEAIGFGVDKPMQFSSAQELADQLLGVQGEVRVKHNVSKGTTYANASAWRPLTYGGQDTDLFAPDVPPSSGGAGSADVPPEDIPF
jgi:hypothetical protein